MPDQHAPWSSASDEQLLTAALAGNNSAWAAAVTRISPRISSIARRWAPDFSGDRIAEVVAEVWSDLALRRRSAFDPSKGTLSSFLTAAVRTAIQRVWSAVHPIGSPQKLPSLARRRKYNEADVDGDLGELWASSSALDRWKHEVAQVDARIDIERIVQSASPNVALAVRLMCMHGVSLEESAEAVGLSRFALRRMLRALQRSALAPHQEDLAPAA